MGARQAHCLRQILSVCIINLVAFYSQIPPFNKKPCQCGKIRSLLSWFMKPILFFVYEFSFISELTVACLLSFSFLFFSNR